MKKLPLLFVTCLSAVALAACGNNGGSSATSEQPTSSSEPAPAKTDWTADEKALMEDALEYSLPFAHGLTIDASVDCAVVASGDAVSAEQIEEYGKAFETLGFVEEEIVYQEGSSGPVAVNLADVYDIVDYDEDPVFWRINSQEEGYIPMYGQIVALGTVDGKFTVCSTEWASGTDSQFSVDNYGYNLSKITLGDVWSFIAASVVYVSSSEDSTEEQLDAQIALFGNLDSASASFAGVDDLQYLYPFSSGNCYSEDWGAGFDLLVAGIEEADVTAWTDALISAGYTKVTQSGVDFYLIEDEDNDCYIQFGVLYDDEFFETESGAEVFCMFESPLAA